MTIAMIFKNFLQDIDSIIARDPAARSRTEVLLTYPGLHALAVHRVSHWLWHRRARLLARLIAQFGRLLTGVDIHPGAVIGRRLFIDHGSGVVIGETAEIGDDVTLYQDVTLGGVAPSVDSAAQVDRKRHPTLMNHVIVGAGAQVLGPITVGEGARVGANAVVVREVAAGASVVGIPARAVGARGGKDFVAYGTPQDLPDPVARAIEGLLDQVSRLQARVDELERRAADLKRDGSTPEDASVPARERAGGSC
jgi:serine O-acetyltransferase